MMSEEPKKKVEYSEAQYAQAEAEGDPLKLLQMLLDEAGLQSKLHGVPVRLTETPEPEGDK